MRLCHGLLVLLLAGCGTTLPKRVEVPIAIACTVGLPASKFTPYTKAELDSLNDGQWVQAVYLDHDLYARYVFDLESIVMACALIKP